MIYSLTDPRDGRTRYVGRSPSPQHADEDLGRSPLDGDAIVDVGANEAPAQLALPASAEAP